VGHRTKRPRAKLHPRPHPVHSAPVHALWPQGGKRCPECPIFRPAGLMTSQLLLLHAFLLLALLCLFLFSLLFLFLFLFYWNSPSSPYPSHSSSPSGVCSMRAPHRSSAIGHRVASASTHLVQHTSTPGGTQYIAYRAWGLSATATPTPRQTPLPTTCCLGHLDRACASTAKAR
jgi:hypothetical protein